METATVTASSESAKALPEQSSFGEEALSAFQRASEKTFSGRTRPWAKVLLAVALVAVVLVSFAIGQYPVTPAGLWEGIQRHFFGSITTREELSVDKIIFSIRMPRIILVLLVGAALSSAGAAYQGLFQNPLVSPDLLGASAGASLGACIGLLFGLNIVVTELLAFATGLLAVAIAVSMNRMVKYDKLLGLVLGGILVSTLFQAGTSIVKLCADVNDKLPSITYWLMGSFSGANQSDLAIAVIPMLCGMVLLMIERWRLNVLSLGEDEARALGVNVKRSRAVVIVAATLLASVSVAVSGVIGWIGLVIPHLGRAIVGPDYRKLLPASMILGGTYLLIVDDFARCLLSMEIPIGVLTAVLGVPFFALVFKYNSKRWA